MLGENIRKIRDSRGYSQQQVADKLNVTRATISSWETDRTEPTMGQVEKLAEIFNCGKLEIIDGKPHVDRTIKLADDEILILETYRKLSAADRLLMYAEMNSKVQHYEDRK